MRTPNGMARHMRVGHYLALEHLHNIWEKKNHVKGLEGCEVSWTCVEDFENS